MSPPPKDMQAAAAKFFTAKQFAVAGASSQPSKFGHKIFAWYLQHDLQAIPMNPTCSEVTVRNNKYSTVPSPVKITHPSETSLSIITPPQITATLLKEAKESGIQAVWLQPGSFTDEILDAALRDFPGAAVGGFADGTVGGEGWCVLVDGERAMKAAGRTKSKRQVIEVLLRYPSSDCSSVGRRRSKQSGKTARSDGLRKQPARGVKHET